jgi:N-acetylglucosaminyl-diphospho-decaprenol L-rhamnosyltransferase
VSLPPAGLSTPSTPLTALTSPTPQTPLPLQTAPPPLSVVIPSRNTRSLTLACLASLAAAARGQPDLATMELVLVDDAGTDGTAEAVAERYPAVRVLRLANQAGFTRAANQGSAAARGEVLLLLNSDTEVEAAGLAGLAAHFAAAPRLGIAGASLRYADGTPQWSGGGEPGTVWLFALASGLPALAASLPLYRRLRPPSGTAGTAATPSPVSPAAAPQPPSETDAPAGDATGPPAGTDGARGEPRRTGRPIHRRSQPRVAWVTGAAMAIRRATWEQVGPLDERFRFYGQDLDLCLRARDAGWEVTVLADLRVVHHHGATIGSEGGRRMGGARGGAQHLELLWTDLVRWAAKRGGAAAARRAAGALRAGGTLRRILRDLAVPLVPAEKRAGFRAETAELAAALAAVAAVRAAVADETC